MARKLGIGRDEGAGEAWKVAPAKAAAAAVFTTVDCGGVVRPCLVGPGDVVPCFGRGLFPDRGFDLTLLGSEPGAALFAANFCGVYGLGVPKSMENGTSIGMSFSEAYILRPGEVTECLLPRRRPGVPL